MGPALCIRIGCGDPPPPAVVQVAPEHPVVAGQRGPPDLRLSAATGIGVFFADPHPPWHRGSNENTSGLLRHYFPTKGANLAVHTPQRLEHVQDELNARPRKTSPVGFLQSSTQRIVPPCRRHLLGATMVNTRRWWRW